MKIISTLVLCGILQAPVALAAAQEEAVSYLDKQRGFLLTTSEPEGGKMEKKVFGTQDGGRHWTALGSPEMGRYYATGITFRSPKMGWVTGTYHGVPDAPLFRTTDGGKSWSLQVLVFPTAYQGGYADVYPPVFMGAEKKHGYLPVHLVRHGDQSDLNAWVHYESADGGETWRLRYLVSACGRK